MSYSATVLADSPLAYWRLGESPGATSLADATGNGHGFTALHGTYTLGSTGLISGDSDTAVSWSNGYADAPSSAPADPLTGDFAIEFWMRSNASGNIVPFTGATGATYTWQSGTQIQLYLSDLAAHTSAASVYDNLIHHIVFTRESGSLKCYVDGALDTNFGSVSANCFFSSLSLGAYTGGLYNFTGTLDEVAVYGAALSSVRVAAHHTAGSSSSAPIAAFARVSTPVLGCGVT